VDPEFLVFAWFVYGFGGYPDDLPLELYYLPSNYSYPHWPHNYVIACAEDNFEENPVVAEYGCMIGVQGGPDVEVVSPNGGEYLESGTLYDIEWTSSGLTNVTIEYTSDGGDTWNLIAESILTENGILNSYVWSVPEVSSTACRVRVADTDGDPVDQSDSDFEIGTGPPPSITIMYPNNGEELPVGSEQTLQWTSQAIDDVRIEYGTPDRKFWTTVVESTPSAQGEYVWQIPDDPGFYHLRVCDALDGDPCDLTDQMFEIYGPITITAPAGGEEWMVGTQQEISWASSGIENVGIRYGQEGDWTLVVDTVPAADGSYTWTIPDDPRMARIAIFDAADEDPFAVSNEFEIYSPTVVVTQPNGGESWIVGTSQSITWDWRGVFETVSIEYATDAAGRATWHTIASETGNDGQFTWVIPDDVSTECRVRVCAVDVVVGGVCDESDGTFGIQEPSGGPNANVKLAMHVVASSAYLYCDDLQMDVAANGVNGSVTQAELDAVGGYAYVAFVAYDYERLSGVEWRVGGWPAGMGAPPPPTVNLCPETSLMLGNPMGTGGIQAFGECRYSNTELEFLVFAWFVYGFEGFSGYLPLELHYLSSSYSYPGWPHNFVMACAEDLFVESLVVEEHGCLIGGQSSPYVLVASPNGGEYLESGTQHNVEWYSFELSSVNLEYTLDGGDTWTLIAESMPTLNYTLNSYSWTVPDIASTTCRIRVSDTDGDPSDESDADFEIGIGPEPLVTITYPNDGESLVVGSEQTLQWTSQAVDDVRIEYGTPDRKSWTTIVESTPAAPGEYLWQVPDDPGFHHLRICDVLDDDPCDMTDQVFEIHESITITAPAGGEEWMAGTPQEIHWISAGIESIGIWYGQEGDWTPIADALPAASGSHLWTVPNDPRLARVVVFDASDSDPFVVSNEFEIYSPTVTVTQPNGGESWIVGTSQSITWDWRGAFDTVSIDYATDATGKQTWQTVVSETENDGEYTWVVPDDPSSQCMVRVCAIDVVVEDTCDSSDNVFWIQETVVVTAPNGGEHWIIGSDQEITWTSAGIANVSIGYGDDDVGWTEIVASTPSTPGSYTWTIPDDPGDWLVRICDAEDGLPCDESDATFKIRSSQYLLVTSPAGGEEWVVHTIHEITWEVDDVMNIGILYGLPGERSWTMIEDSYPAIGGSYLWQVPNDPGIWRIAIFDAEDDDPFTMSEEFEIVDPDIPQHFTFTSNTGCSYSMVIADAYSLCLPLEHGDEVGVFDGDLCVGASVWTLPPPVGLVAWCDDPETGEIDGYVCGNRMSFKIWDNSLSRYRNGTPHYAVGDGRFCTGDYSQLNLFARHYVGPPPLLGQPNPLNPDTDIRYVVPGTTPVDASLRIYNSQGQLVRVLIDEFQQPGEHVVHWNGRNSSGQRVSSGVFFCVLRAGDARAIEKLVVVR
jgi:hypothetical protein